MGRKKVNDNYDKSIRMIRSALRRVEPFIKQVKKKRIFCSIVILLRWKNILLTSIII